MKGRERSFADLEWENKKHKTRREKLLERMEVLIPWEKILEQIRPYYGGAGKGRVPYPLESIGHLDKWAPMGSKGNCCVDTYRS